MALSSRKIPCTLLALVGIAILVLGHCSYNQPSRGNNGEWKMFQTLLGGSKSPKHLVSRPFPTKIWQSWRDSSEDPTERTKGFPQQWRAVNPGYRYERFTDDNIDQYVRRNFDLETAEVFTALQDSILKADFLRYLILLREGGVWADIDVYPRRPVSAWVPAEFVGQVNLVIGIENDHHKSPIWRGSPYSVQLCQYVILAKADHPAMEMLVGETRAGLVKMLADRKLGEKVTFEDVMKTTGPFLFTKVLMEYFHSQTGVKYTGDELDELEKPRLIGDVLVLPKDSFGWLPQEHKHDREDPMVLVEHLFMGSWRESHAG